MSCSTCEKLGVEQAAAKTVTQHAVLGALLDQHLKSRHPDLLRELASLDTVEPVDNWKADRR